MLPSPGVTYVFRLRGILLARGVARHLPEARLLWQRDPEIQAALARAGGHVPGDDLPFALDPGAPAHRRIQAAALGAPARTAGKILLRRPRIVGLIGIEAQEIRLLALALDDAAAPIS